MESLVYPPFVKTDADRSAFDVGRVGGWSEWITHVSDLRAIEKGCTFDIARAQYVRDFFETQLFIAPEVPFKLLDFQWRDIIAPWAGWLGPDRKRRLRFFYVEVPKGAGKSLICSGLALYLLIADGRMSPDVYFAGYDRVQTKELVKAVREMVYNSPDIASLVKVIPSKSLITLKGTQIGSISPLSKDTYNSQGIKPHGVIYEELHSWKNAELYNGLKPSVNKRGVDDHDTPIGIAITTAGGERVGVGWNEHQFARNFLDENLTDYPLNYRAVIYAADEDDDIHAEATWKKANPAYGTVATKEEMESLSAQAKASFAAEILLRRYRLNQWFVGNDKPWLDLKQWRECPPAWDLYGETGLIGRPAYYALDLSATSDMTSLTILIPEGNGSFHVIPYFWCASLVAEAKQRQNRLTPYREWGNMPHPILGGNEKLLNLMDGNIIDYNVMHAKIVELSNLFPVTKIIIDNKFNGQHEVNRFIEEGYDVAPFYGGFGAPCVNLRKLVGGRQIRHGNNQILNWMMGNMRTKIDDKGWEKPDKIKSTGKIDGVVTLLMALAWAKQSGDEASNDPGIYYLGMN